MKKYTFEGSIQTMSFYQNGEVSAFGHNEEEARNSAIQQLCKIHMIGANCINLRECINVE